MNVSLHECNQFAEFLLRANKENQYLEKLDPIHLEEDVPTNYRVRAIKPRDFKTAQIIELAKAHIHFLKNDQASPLTDRIQICEKLKVALKKYASRVKKSIKNRWWYLIYRLFFAKCKIYPLKSVLKEATHSSRLLRINAMSLKCRELQTRLDANETSIELYEREVQHLRALFNEGGPLNEIVARLHTAETIVELIRREQGFLRQEIKLIENEQLNLNLELDG